MIQSTLRRVDNQHHRTAHLILHAGDTVNHMGRLRLHNILYFKSVRKQAVRYVVSVLWYFTTSSPRKFAVLLPS